MGGRPPHFQNGLLAAGSELATPVELKPLLSFLRVVLLHSGVAIGSPLA
jgi:hypothetical protein